MGEPNADDYAAAERLVREAAARAEQAVRNANAPPRGWQGDGGANAPFPDLSLLLGLADAARGALPPELARAVVDALRDLLLALRAILDYSIEMLDRPGPEEPRVEDIPIS